MADAAGLIRAVATHLLVDDPEGSNTEEEAIAILYELLGAMWDPTPAMVAAGLASLDGVVDEERLATGWRAMVDVLARELGFGPPNG